MVNGRLALRYFQCCRSDELLLVVPKQLPGTARVFHVRATRGVTARAVAGFDSGAIAVIDDSDDHELRPLARANSPRITAAVASAVIDEHKVPKT